MNMQLDRFEQIVRSYGADPARWPGDEREAAQHLLDQSAAARAMLAAERELDGFLDASGTRLPDGTAMAERVRAGVLSEVRRGFLDRVVDWFEQALWHGAALACIPLVLGVAIGMGTAEEVTWSLDQDEEISLLAISESSNGWIYDEE